MHLCDDGHGEVCYDGRDCPVCEKMEEIKILEKKVEELENVE